MGAALDAALAACGTCGKPVRWDATSYDTPRWVHVRISDLFFCGYQPQELDGADLAAAERLARAEDLLSGTAGAIERRELPQLTSPRGTAA